MTFRISINRLYPGEKVAHGDERHSRYHGVFVAEAHTPASLLEEIKRGHAFCAGLLTGDCGREHHGERWCCKERRDNGDPTHCGRPEGYRVSHHFKSAQHLALDLDTGNLDIDDVLADQFIATYATFIYPTISWTPDYRKWRVVFILTEPINDPGTYRKAATALLARHTHTDQQVKDPARLFFGMKPGNGEALYLGNLLPMTEVLTLVGEYEERRRELDRQSSRREIPLVEACRITGNTPDEKYISRAIQEERDWLASQVKGTGGRHHGLLLVAARLESLRLSDWLAPEARATIDPYAIVLEAAQANGYLDEYGEEDTRRAIAWGIGVADPRPQPPDWGQSRRILERAEALAENHGVSKAAGLPHIEVNNRWLRDITNDALAALERANHPPYLFVRGTKVVRLALSGASAEVLTLDSMKGTLDRAANFCKRNREGEPVPARPPSDVCKDIMSLQHPLPFPDLKGFASTPTFLPDGSLLGSEGYHPGSGVYVRLNGLEAAKTDMPLAEARTLLLDELLVDFPFADDASVAHTIAALLLPFVRQMIDGPTPLHLADAPARGTGKGLLFQDILGIIATGTQAYVMALPRDEDEIEKRVTATLMTGHQLILLDNISKLHSSTLSAALTTTLWEGRLLGKSEMIHAPNTATWLAMGNNVELSDEMSRRTVVVRLDAGVEAPEERTGFRYQLPAWAVEHRGALVTACLSVVQHWIDNGMPRSRASLGRFEAWAGAMGGILEVMELPGFLGNRDQQKSRDPESQEWTALCASWYSRHGNKPIGARGVLDLAKESQLLLHLWSERRDLSALQRIGHALKEKRDRVFGGYQIRHTGSNRETGTAEYSVMRLHSARTPSNPRKPWRQAERNGDQHRISGHECGGLGYGTNGKTPAHAGTGAWVDGVCGGFGATPSEDPTLVRHCDRCRAPLQAGTTAVYTTQGETLCGRCG